MIPKPKLPKLNLEDEVGGEGYEDEYTQTQDETRDFGKEKMANAFAKVLGFVAAIGLPQEVMKEKIIYYSQLAEETGVAEALIDTIEYYFPDIEASPALVLALTGTAFFSAVMADRAETKKKFQPKEKLQKKPSAGQIEQEKAKKMQESVKVE